jgi:hypothetical protein
VPGCEVGVGVVEAPGVPLGQQLASHCIAVAGVNQDRVAAALIPARSRTSRTGGMRPD